MSQLEITPTPTEEEAAAIVAAFSTLAKPEPALPVMSRWKLSGRDWGATPASLGMTSDDR